jgi:AraC-like DNA-binding protein
MEARYAGRMTRAPDLLDRRIAVSVSLAGFPGSMTVPGAWDTGTISLPEHMVYFVRRGRIRIDDERIDAGGCALIPPGVTFRARSPDGSAASIMRCRLDARRGGPLAIVPRITVRQGSWELEPVVAMLIEEAGAAAGDRARCLALLLVTGLARSSASVPGLDAHQRRSLAEFVDRHHAHGLEPRDLAAHLGLTHDYFTRRFRLAYGMAPRPWLVRERIRAACVLIAEGEGSLEHAAAQLGYGDLKLFGRQFRQVMGMPPGRWRKRRMA